MSPSAAKILEQALQLDAAEQRELALDLLDAVTGDPGIEAEWIRESQRRLANVESGEVTPLTDAEAERLIDADG